MQSENEKQQTATGVTIDDAPQDHVACTEVTPPDKARTQPTPSAQHTRPRWSGYTAFVLSGGGARGALQVGALRALMEHGEHPDVVIGTSIGSWNGAWLAREPTLDGIEKLAAHWRGLTTARVLLGHDLLPGSPPQALTGMLMLTAARRMTRGASSLYSNDGLRRLLEQHLAATTFEELKLPFRVVASDLTRGGRAIFSSGQVLPALLASSAIPGIFPPVRIGDGVYCDGGAVDPCSVDLALALGARRLFILAIGHDTEADGGAQWSHLPTNARKGHEDEIEALSTANVIERAGQVMGHYQLERALERIPRGIETHVLSLSSGDGNGMLDFAMTGKWIEQAYAATREYLREHLPQRLPTSEQNGDDTLQERATGAAS